MYLLYIVFLVLVALLAGAKLPASAEADAVGGQQPESGFATLLQALEIRARIVQRHAADLTAIHSYDVAPLVQLLTARGAEREWAKRIVIALVREGRVVGVDPRLLLSVVLVEDPALDSAAVSPVGALGLMQVMPLHVGNWGCPKGDLRNPEINVCYGSRILAYEIARASGNLDVALLRYNGCVRGAFTPDCHLYPMRVFRMAALGWLGDERAEVYGRRRLSRSAPIE